MTLNIYTLRKHEVKESDIVSIYRKIYNSTVESSCKMVTTDRGYIISAAHFEVDDLIKEIKKFLKVCRSYLVKRNTKLLGILERVRLEIAKEISKTTKEIESGK
jgi:hypothetical protein